MPKKRSGSCSEIQAAASAPSRGGPRSSPSPTGGGGSSSGGTGGSRGGSSQQRRRQRAGEEEDDRPRTASTSKLRSEGAHYRGEDEKLSGFHLKVYPSGDRYEGCFEGGRRSGRGRYLWASGDRYEGHWAAGRMHGAGTFFWNTGDVHSGAWRNGRAAGLGVRVALDGERTEGCFENGLAEGWARKTYSFGDAYEGLVRRSERQGFGSYSWRNGDRYCGMWGRDRMTGPGTFDKHFRSGEDLPLTEIVHYSGEYVNGKFGGYGVARFADGEEYSGEWIDGLRHGWGRSTWCSHASSAGTNSGTSNYATPWEFINPLGDIEPANNGAGMTGHASAGALQEQLGDVALSALREHGCIVQETYEGGHAGGFREGAGCFHRLVFTLNRDSGAVSCECEAYEGHWRAGQQHGWGAMTYTNGSMYRGEFLEGLRHGRGELLTWGDEAGPVSLSGRWSNNELASPV